MGRRFWPKVLSADVVDGREMVSFVVCFDL